MVGCLPGYRPERTVKTAMLAYECQNISVVGDIKVDGTMRSGDHGIMPVPGTMRSPSWEPPRGNPRGFTPVNPARRPRPFRLEATGAQKY
jgi:hypothetical protein